MAPASTVKSFSNRPASAMRVLDQARRRTPSATMTSLEPMRSRMSPTDGDVSRERLTAECEAHQGPVRRRNNRPAEFERGISTQPGCAASHAPISPVSISGAIPT